MLERIKKSDKNLNLSLDDVQWVVNEGAELGVKIGNSFFWLFKGSSIVYINYEIKWRPVEPLEFGATCCPVNHTSLKEGEKYCTGSGWKTIGDS